MTHSPDVEKPHRTASEILAPVIKDSEAEARRRPWILAWAIALDAAVILTLGSMWHEYATHRSALFITNPPTGICKPNFMEMATHDGRYRFCLHPAAVGP